MTEHQNDPADSPETPDAVATPAPSGDETTAAATGDPDHYGQDGGRDTLTVSGAQQQAAGDAEQNVPAMSQNNATDDEKIDGIVKQTRQDLAGADHDEIVRVLRQRFSQTGVAVPDDARVDEFARWVAGR
ncbi:hypothetical protein N3K63_10810 [Microbacterium sp. W1N]|uniref:hypothetical protein n=1 Tax=Microbacterium festucae TaxID=2977531 RepID=UPI0021C2459F|nr:hypothetical protein [Microbacterium festucae]MCT9820773.1 hypothetical protein [Microbacterium festucae]